MRQFNTYTQLRCKCEPTQVLNQQDREFVEWLVTVPHNNLLDLTEKHETDVSDYYSFKKYEQGQAPWNVITYTNTTRIVDLTELLSRVDQLASQLSTNGYFYLALNKWTMLVSNPNPELAELTYDDAINQYVVQNIKNYKLVDYRYIDNDRGGLGNFVHGNNRCWLQRI
jgi:hypothetical protein